MLAKFHTKLLIEHVIDSTILPKISCYYKNIMQNQSYVNEATRRHDDTTHINDAQRYEKSVAKTFV